MRSSLSGLTGRLEVALVGVTGSHESSLESAADTALHCIQPPIKHTLRRPTWQSIEQPNILQFLGENSRVGGIEAILKAETRDGG